MINLNGVNEINGHKVLTLHGSITERDKFGFGIHVDYIKPSIVFVGDAATPDTLRAAADMLEYEKPQPAQKSDETPAKNTTAPKRRIGKRGAAA
jgi:hypothetical protein